jgi:hypothetical protein
MSATPPANVSTLIRYFVDVGVCITGLGVLFGMSFFKKRQLD